MVDWDVKRQTKTNKNTHIHFSNTTKKKLTPQVKLHDGSSIYFAVIIAGNVHNMKPVQNCTYARIQRVDRGFPPHTGKSYLGRVPSSAHKRNAIEIAFR